MANNVQPIIDHWYQHLDKGQAFQVVDVDDHARLIEIQHFDGDLEEISLEDWYQMEIDAAEDPENWSGIFDVSELDDLGTDITDTATEDWTAPLNEIHSVLAAADGNEAGEDDTDDDWGEGYPIEEPWDGDN
jgi:hypothetical protein